MEGRNICLINDSFPPVIDGVANAVTNYAKILRSHGGVSVLTPYDPEAEDGQFDFPVLRYPSLAGGDNLGYRVGIPLSPELMHRVEMSGFDLIHSHCPITSTILGRMIRDRIHKPLVMTYHTKFDIDIANTLRGKLIQQEAIRLLAENISACDEVWTVSRGAGENLRKIGYKGEYTVMPNGVDLPKGRVTDAEIEKVTGGYDLPAGVPVFLFVGRMMWYKGIRIILDGLKRLQNAGQDFRMVFIGGGGDEAEIRACCEELQLSGQVLFVPPVYDRDVIRAWYCRADLFLFPSTFDTNGLVVREAASCGLASVLVEGSCAAEDAADGETAFFMEENADSLSALLLRLCAEPGQLRRVGENAQSRLYLSWEDAVERAAGRYETVMENYARGLYAPHDRFGDELFHRTAQAMDDVERVRRRMRMLHEDAAEREKQLRETIRHGIDRFL